MLGKFLRAVGMARFFRPRGGSDAMSAGPGEAARPFTPPVLPVLLGVFVDVLKNSDQPHEADIGKRMEARVQGYQHGELDAAAFERVMREDINALRTSEVDDNLAGLLDLLEADILSGAGSARPGAGDQPQWSTVVETGEQVKKP